MGEYRATMKARKEQEAFDRQAKAKELAKEKMTSQAENDKVSKGQKELKFKRKNDRYNKRV